MKKGMLEKRKVNWTRVKNEKRKRERKHRKVLATNLHTQITLGYIR